MRNLADERGVGLIEVVMAILLFLLVAGVAFTALVSAEQHQAGSERQSAAVALAQREVERMRQLGWAALGVTSMPVAASASSDPAPDDPNEYVSAGRLLVKADFRRRSSGPAPGVAAAGEPIVVVAAGVAPGPARVTSGGYAFDVYRYVTAANFTCMVGTVDQCPSTQDAKRIVVAVRPVLNANKNGMSKPVWTASLVTDPNAIAAGATEPPTPAPTGPTAQQFFLYDTTCDNAVRVARTGAHAARDTGRSADCAIAATRPDLMGRAPAPVEATAMPDYASDYPSARTGPAGLALLPPTAAQGDCPTSYGAAADKHRVHRWVTPRMPQAFTSTTLSALTVWTRTVNGALGPARLCAALHKVSTGGTLSATALATTSYPITDPGWPQEATQVAFTFEHPAISLAVNERLALSLSLSRDSAPGGIELWYDDNQHSSQLALGTMTPLP